MKEKILRGLVIFMNINNSFLSSNLHIFEQVSSMTDDGFIVVNRKGDVIHINDKYCEFLGTTKDKALGKSIFNIIPNSHMLEVMEKKYSEECVIQNYILGKEKEKSAIVSRSYVEDEFGNIIAGVAQVKFRVETLDVAKKLIKEYVELEFYKQEYLDKTNKDFYFDKLVGKSEAFSKIKKIAQKASRTNFSVLITGDTGTGKEVIAKAIHNNSDRKDKPLVTLNCAAIPEELFESELFGYEDGAFTGAKKGGKKGKFFIANNGTIFLDEIGDLPLSMQVKLLRVLQEKEIDPIGSLKPIPINVRVIAATRKDLSKLITTGEFREDLYYRLNVINIEMPNLIERQADILEFADYFLNKLNLEYNTLKTFSSAVKQCLQAYSWPGNIRELDNVIKSAYAINDSSIIELSDLPSKLVTKSSNILDENQNPSLEDLLSTFEKKVILENLKKAHWDCKQVANEFKIHPSVLYKKIKKYNISKKEVL